MAPPSKLPTTGSEEPTSGRASKRRRLGERDAPNETQAAHQKRLDEAGDRSVYDPDQTIEERRAIRKEYRDLSRELTGAFLVHPSLAMQVLTLLVLDSRAEYLQTNSNGLVATLEKANDLYGNVKQTSDATLDSRLLVSTADLSVKRTQQLNLGDGGQGIDVDDFINKCRSFMRRADSSFQAPESTQRRRRRGYEAENDSAAEASADEGDEYNWEWLGRQACFPSNLRPPVPGFLLGPLSVQKRARKQTQRRERLRRQDPRDAIRPEEVKVTENEKAENNNLTFLCNKIRALLGKMQAEGQEAAQNEATDDMTEDELLAVFEKHGLAPDGGIPLFRFVINPNSFGQSVENLFYTSFLIKEGRFGVEFDSRGLPTLRMSFYILQPHPQLLIRSARYGRDSRGTERTLRHTQPGPRAIRAASGCLPSRFRDLGRPHRRFRHQRKYYPPPRLGGSRSGQCFWVVWLKSRMAGRREVSTEFHSSVD